MELHLFSWSWSRELVFKIAGVGFLKSGESELIFELFFQQFMEWSWNPKKSPAPQPWNDPDLY